MFQLLTYIKDHNIYTDYKTGGNVRADNIAVSTFWSHLMCVFVTAVRFLRQAHGGTFCLAQPEVMCSVTSCRRLPDGKLAVTQSYARCYRAWCAQYTDLNELRFLVIAAFMVALFGCIRSGPLGLLIRLEMFQEACSIRPPAR